MQVVLFPQGCDLRHHGRGVVRVEGGLIPPLVDEQNSFRIIHREKIFIAQIAFLGPNCRRDPAAGHFLSEGSGAAVRAGIVEIDGNHSKPPNKVRIKS